MPVASVVMALVIGGFALWLVTLIPMHPTFKQIVIGVVILAVILWLLHVLFGIGPGINLR